MRNVFYWDITLIALENYINCPLNYNRENQKFAIIAVADIFELFCGSVFCVSFCDSFL